MSKMYTKCDDYLKNQVLDWFQSPKDDKFLGLTFYLLLLHSYFKKVLGALVSNK